MQAIALVKAKEHLELAKQAAASLTLENGFQPYEQAWSRFLSQVSRFYSKLEQGAKGCQVSEPWFGVKRHERRKDDLLSYLHHARDSDEHGLDHITRRRAERSTITFPETQEVSVSMWVKMNDDGSWETRDAKVRTPDGEFEKEELTNARVELVTVHDRRYGNSFDPPVMHRTRPIVDRSPPHLAALAIRYMQEMMEEAAGLPKQH